MLGNSYSRKMFVNVGLQLNIGSISIIRKSQNGL